MHDVRASRQKVTYVRLPWFEEFMTGPVLPDLYLDATLATIVDCYGCVVATKIGLDFLCGRIWHDGDRMAGCIRLQVFDRHR
jgi:hypothetical protein